MKTLSPYRLLLWLKWTLTWRKYRNNRFRLLSTVAFLIVFLPVSFFGAFGVWWFLEHNLGKVGMQATRDALAIIYWLWIMSPLLGFPVNESYDLTKLFVYPLSFRQIFWGSILGNLIDQPVLLVFPTLVVLLIVYSTSPLAYLLNAALLLLFLIHTIALSQAITIALVGFLRSRRFRDITIVVLPILALFYYIGQQTFLHKIREGGAQFRDNSLWHIADLLPPGYTAVGLSSTSSHDFSFALVQLYGLICACILATLLAAGALRRLYLGDVGPRGSSSAPRAKAADPVANLGVSLLSRLPSDVAAVAAKEFIYFRREPQYKAMLANALYIFSAMMVPILLPHLSAGRAPTSSLFGGLALSFSRVALLFCFVPLLFNIFGGEGAAITVLFSLPTRRRAMLLGKNVAHATALLLFNALALTMIAAVVHRWSDLPISLLSVLLTAPVLLATGNLISIRFPQRLLIRGQRFQRGGVAAASGDGAGCLYSVLYLIGYLGAFIALLPVIAAIIIPSLPMVSKGWYALSLPLGFLYSCALYWILLGQAESWLLTREPEIATAIVPAD